MSVWEGYLREYIPQVPQCFLNSIWLREQEISCSQFARFHITVHATQPKPAPIKVVGQVQDLLFVHKFKLISGKLFHVLKPCTTPRGAPLIPSPLYPITLDKPKYTLNRKFPTYVQFCSWTMLKLEKEERRTKYE